MRPIFLARADGGNIGNGAAFPISSAITAPANLRIFAGREATDAAGFSCYRPDFNKPCE
jgi:hypothetical protein